MGSVYESEGLLKDSESVVVQFEQGSSLENSLKYHKLFRGDLYSTMILSAEVFY